MSPGEIALGPVGQDRSGATKKGLQQDEQPNHTPKPQEEVSRPLSLASKRAAVLRVFLDRGERGLTCFEAVPLAHDYVLRTTVSEITRYHGIAFSKEYERVPGFAGSKVDCVRYRLTAEGAAKARELLGVA